MSKFKAVESVMNNQQRIVESLETVCPEFAGKIEVAQPGSNSIALIGHGEAQVDIAIRSRNMKGKASGAGYADMGLKWNGQVFEWVISDCDMGEYEKKRDADGNEIADPRGHFNSTYGEYGDQFLQQINSVYAALELIEQVKSKGGRVIGELQKMDNGEWGVEAEIDESQLVRAGIRM